MKIKFWSNRDIVAAFPKRGGKYKGILTRLMLERSMTYRRQIRYLVNEDIDKIMRRIN